MPPKLTYPTARTGDVVDDYWGTRVADPYRWLEHTHSAETKKWIEAENELTFGWLREIPARAPMRARLEALWDFAKYGVPTKEAGRYFYEENPGLLPQPRLFWRDGLHGTPKVLLDPSTLRKDGTAAVSGWSVSRDGHRLAYAISDAGSDWMTWRVRDVDTGKDLPDEVKWSKFSGASWAHDGSGFYYSAYDPPKDPKKALTGTNYYQKLYFHRLGTKQSEDRLVYERKDHEDWGFSGAVTDDGHYLVIHVGRGTSPKNQVFYEDLTVKTPKVIPLIEGFDARWEMVGNEGSVFHFRTDKDAPRGRIVSMDVGSPGKVNEIVPESKDTLSAVSLVGGRLACSYLADAHGVARVYDLHGKQAFVVPTPGLGTIEGLGGHEDDPETFFAFTGFAQPKTIYRYDVHTGKAEVFAEPKVDFDPDAFVTEQVFYESKDGTRVPMFIVHKQGLVRDGNNPTYLYGYGGFDISMTPSFSVSVLTWVEMGGIFALPNIRGGGEYGEAWHLAGTGLHKQTVFDDFIAAAKWLIARKYTRTPKLAIAGGSNGGLLTGACLTEQPSLFGAAVVEVGVLDMLRYQDWTIGWAWASDYGTAKDSKEMFEALYAYSPYHNIHPGMQYPPTLVTTSDHDDRVMPAHSFKFAARLQHAQGGDAPILIRIETRAGHGAGKPTDKLLDEIADRFGFLSKVLDMKVELPALSPRTSRTP